MGQPQPGNPSPPTRPHLLLVESKMVGIGEDALLGPDRLRIFESLGQDLVRNLLVCFYIAELGIYRVQDLLDNKRALMLEPLM